MTSSIYCLSQFLLKKLLVTVVLCSSTFIWGQKRGIDETTADVRLIIRLEKGRLKFKAGEPIRISIILKNASKSTIVVPVSCIELNYTLEVQRKNGDAVSMSAEGKRLSSIDPSVCRRKTLSLQTDKSIHAELDATLLYDLTKSGQYYISVQRTFRTQAGVLQSAASKPMLITIE